MQKNSIREVAKIAGVSPATVSRYINGKSDPSSELNQKLREIILKTGYRKKRYKKSYSHTVLFFSSSFDSNNDTQKLHGHCHTIMSNVEMELARRDIKMIKTNSEMLHSAIDEYNISGIISSSDIPNDLTVPVVCVNPSLFFMDYACVESDEFFGMLSSVRHLAEHGHDRIGIFCDVKLTDNVLHPRKCFFPQIFTMCGLKYDKNLIWNESFPSGEHDPVIRRAVDYFMNLEEPPTALAMVGDVYAPGFYEEFRKKGLSIPDDISIVGYDDSPLAELLHPKLSSIKKPLQEMAAEAVRILVDKIDNNSQANPRILLKPELVERESVTAPKK